MIGSLIAMLLVTDNPPSLESLYAAARHYDRTSFRFSPPASDRLLKMRSLVAMLAASNSTGKPIAQQAVADARQLDLELVVARDAVGEVWVLREAHERRAGDGFYVFRPGGRSLCVQAPHTFFDQGTGEIALSVFAQTKAACLFVNTVHRYARSTTPDHPADVAHANQTMFRSATEGLLDALRLSDRPSVRPSVRLSILQVHGFTARRAIPADVLAIISDGTSRPDPQAAASRLRAALQARLSPGRVFLFGRDTRELGATTNVEGVLARKAGAAFVHVELSESLRERLRTQATDLFAEAIREALPSHQ
jgi:hypothetical protein